MTGCARVSSFAGMSGCAGIAGCTCTTGCARVSGCSGCARESGCSGISGCASPAARTGASGCAGIAARASIPGSPGSSSRALRPGRTCRKRNTSTQSKRHRSCDKQFRIFHDDFLYLANKNHARYCEQSPRIDQFLATVISVGRSGHRYCNTASACRPARISPGVYPVGALRMSMRLRDLPGRFSALARITGFFRGITRAAPAARCDNRHSRRRMHSERARTCGR